MTQNYHTAISPSAAASASNINTPLSNLDSGITELAGHYGTGNFSDVLTVSSGEITPTKYFHQLEPESGFSDTIDTINYTLPTFGENRELVLYTAARTFTFSTTGNISLSANATFGPLRFVKLLYVSGTWYIVNVTTTGFSGYTLPQHYYLHPYNFTVESGNAITFSINTSFVTNAIYYQNTPAINDKLSIAVWLDSGTWEWGFVAQKNTTMGIVTPAYGSTNLSTEDLYNGSPAHNHIFTRSFSVTSPSFITLSTTVASKNASSGDYFFPFAYSWLRKT